MKFTLDTFPCVQIDLTSAQRKYLYNYNAINLRPILRSWEYIKSKVQSACKMYLIIQSNL